MKQNTVVQPPVDGLEKGAKVYYDGNPDDVWYVLKVSRREDGSAKTVCASKNYRDDGAAQQWFAAGVFLQPLRERQEAPPLAQYPALNMPRKIISEVDALLTSMWSGHKPAPVVLESVPKSLLDRIPVIPEKPARTPTPRIAREKKEKARDPIADVLAEAKSVDEVWAIGRLAGLDQAELKAKIGHLSNGLQRMGIGNRIRTKWKHGELDAEKLMVEVLAGEHMKAPAVKKGKAKK